MLKKIGFWLSAILTLTPVLAPTLAHAAEINGADTAWMMTSTALVLMMTIPGLALFYGGLVRKQNVLATTMQSFATCCLVAVVWTVCGYSLAFGEGNAFIGDLSRFLLHDTNINAPLTLGTGASAVSFTISEPVFMMFQMTFAIITPALIAGAFADRMKFSAMLWFMGLWSLLVYAPICHWVWHPNGFLFADGVLDFAGGTVVHINAGIAGLVCALVLGKRIGYPTATPTPNNLVYSLIGASLLWVGWFGFNGGSAAAANSRAGMAIAVTMVAAAAAAVTWMMVEWGVKGKPSVVGKITGAVAGLVAITPASGFVDITGAMWIGVIGGIFGFWGVNWLKERLAVDDSLDAFGVHGLCGIVGAVLTGVFAKASISGSDSVKGLIDGNADQIITQLEGIGATIVWCALATFIILKVVGIFTRGLRVDEGTEREGLDRALHGEAIP